MGKEKVSADRAENWDKYKLKIMIDAIVQMKTLSKYKNYNSIDFDESKNANADVFIVVRNIAKEIHEKMEMIWTYSVPQMIAKWKITKKQYKAAARKAQKTGNDNEQRMELMAAFPSDMPTLICKSAASIDPIGLVDSAGSRKKPMLIDTGRVARNNNKTASNNHSRKQLLEQLSIANALQHTDLHSNLIIKLMGQFPDCTMDELNEKAIMNMNMSKATAPKSTHISTDNSDGDDNSKSLSELTTEQDQYEEALPKEAIQSDDK